MKKKMSIMGVAPKLAVVTAVYLTAMICLSNLVAPFGSFPPSARTILTNAGIVLVAVGLSFHGVAAHKLLKRYKKGELITDGPFAVFLNPMYASAILFTVPGVALMLGSWLVITTSVVMFIAHKLLIRSEEEYLKKTFGAAYDAYAKKVFIRL